MPAETPETLLPGARALFDHIVARYGLLLDTKQAAEVVGSTAGSLEEQRARGVGLPHVRLGRSVKYRADQLAEFLERQTVRPLNIEMNDAA